MLETCINRRQSEWHLGEHNYGASGSWLVVSPQTMAIGALLWGGTFAKKADEMAAGLHRLCAMAFCSVPVRPVNRHHYSDLKIVGMTWEWREGRQICTDLELCIEKISVGYQSAVSTSLNLAKESAEFKFKSVEIQILFTFVLILSHETDCTCTDG
jgi:hypothetical protein